MKDSYTCNCQVENLSGVIHLLAKSGQVHIQFTKEELTMNTLPWREGRQQGTTGCSVRACGFKCGGVGGGRGVDEFFCRNPHCKNIKVAALVMALFGKTHL